MSVELVIYSRFLLYFRITETVPPRACSQANKSSQISSFKIGLYLLVSTIFPRVILKVEVLACKGYRESGGLCMSSLEGLSVNEQLVWFQLAKRKELGIACSL